MKITILILFFSILFLSYQSNEKPNPEKEEKPTSRILDIELKEILPELIKLHNQTYKNNRHNNLNITFLSTENYVYAHLTKLDCEKYLPLYMFDEKVDSFDVRFYIYANSLNPERYFDLSNLTVIPNEFQAIICDDFYFLKAKFVRIEDELNLVDIRTRFNNDLNFYEKSDSAYLHKIEVFMIEPEPTLEPTE